MTLSAGFPLALREQSVRRQLVPGAVVKFEARMDDGKVKEKRFLILAVDADTVTFVMNSEIGAFIQSRPQLLKCQAPIDAASHPFMDHDSHVDCSRFRLYSTSEVVRQLVARPDWILGTVSADVRAQVAAAAKASPLISPAELTELLKEFESD